MFDNRCRWIWLDENTGAENQYVEFRRVFRLNRKVVDGQLLIAADSDYQVFVNGIEVYGRQYSDYPHHRSCDTYDIGRLLRRGGNSVAVLGYYRGRGASDYRRGRPGLIVQINAGQRLIFSDRFWRVRLSSAYVSGGHIDQATKQMGFTVQYDAGREDGWRTVGYRADVRWLPAAELARPLDGYWRSIEPRVLPQMTRAPFRTGQVVCIGELIRPVQPESHSPSLAVAAEFKTARRPPPSRQGPWLFSRPREPANGGYLLCDMGVATFGLLRIEIEAPAGTLIDAAHGEHIEDLGVRAAPGYRRFTDRFVCRGGENVLSVPFRRLGCRYIELHITNFRRPVSVRAVGLEPLEYPVKTIGAFDCADSALLRLQTVSIHTLKQCMGDHYFDCPWREQSLYSYDSRNQALYGYYIFGEYAYPRQSFRLLGWGERDDGLIEMCAPANTGNVIPVFSLVWITALYEHWLFSGRPALFNEFRPLIERILHTFLSRRDESTGVCKSFKGYWLFYEWTTGMDHQPERGPGSGFRLDAPHNLYLVEAIRAYAAMLALNLESAAAAQWRRCAARLAVATHRTFWNPGRRLYATYVDGRRRQKHYSAGVQALALCNTIAPSKFRAGLQASILNDRSMVDISLQVMGYGVRAMHQASIKRQKLMIDRVREIYGGMIENGASTLWEVAHTSMLAPGLRNPAGSFAGGARPPYAGDDAFAEAGSLCHGWSAVPLWVNMAYILGIRPVSPGFKTFAVEPHSCGLPYANGSVPTPRGPIDVKWNIERGRMHIDVRCPRGAVPAIATAPGLRGSPSVTLNGKTFLP